MRIPLFTRFNDVKDLILDNYLLNLINNYEITDISCNSYYMDITFSNNNTKVIFHAWNTNKWYAWLHKGYIKIISKGAPDQNYYWDDSRPRRKTMNKLLKKISDYYNKILNI